MVVWMVTFEPEAFDWIIFQCHGVWNWAYGVWVRIWHHPESPIRRWLIERNANRLAREFLSDIKKKENNHPEEG